jgi:hypothetical protein
MASRPVPPAGFRVPAAELVEGEQQLPVETPRCRSCPMVRATSNTHMRWAREDLMFQDRHRTEAPWIGSRVRVRKTGARDRTG